jgi:hypothetical protein
MKRIPIHQDEFPAPTVRRASGENVDGRGEA